jgi:alternate signal-mediated exported protein
MTNHQSISRTRRRAVLAGALGAALLLTGSTWALWSDSLGLGGSSTISAGDLDLTADGTPSFYDVTGWRTDHTGYPPTPLTQQPNHPIASIEDYLFVPETAVEIDMPITVTMKGDNLVANLAVGDPSKLDTATGGMTGAKVLKAHLYDSTGAEVPLDANNTVMLQTPHTADGTSLAGVREVDGAEQFTAVIQVWFDATDQINTKTFATFADDAVTLEQVKA